MTVDINVLDIYYPGPNTTFKIDMLDEKSPDFSKIKTICDESFNGTYTIQEMKLRLNNETMLSFEFVGNSTRYHVEKVVLTKISDDLSMNVFEVTQPELHLWHDFEFKTEEQGYKCGETTFTLQQISPTVVEKANSNHTAEVTLHEFMFVALQNGTSATDITRMRCRVKPTNSWIPIFVGGGLLGVAAVVVIIYFVMRKRGNSKNEA